MSSWTALIVYALGIVGLFFLDRDGSVRTSKALWLPVIWLWIVGSRPVSIWLGITHFGPPYKELVDGSPFDRLIFLILMALGMLVLIHRSRRKFTTSADKRSPQGELAYLGVFLLLPF